MKKIKYLTIRFNNEIEPWEVPAFRGAIIAKAGAEHILFHNHLNDHELLYGYPVIQYKRVGKNPMIVCIDYGTDEIHHLFSKENLKIKIGDKELTLVVKHLNINQVNLQVWERSFQYEIRNWIALNEDNYAQFRALTNEFTKLEFLEKKLVGNILAFAKGVKWTIDKQVNLRISEIKAQKQVPYKGTRLSGFDVVFKTNVFLPNHISLGKGASLGFGDIHQITDKQ